MKKPFHLLVQSKRPFVFVIDQYILSLHPKKAGTLPVKGRDEVKVTNETKTVIPGKPST